MSDSLALTWVKARHWTYSVPRPGSKDGFWTCPALTPDMSGSLTPQREIPSRGYKRPPRPQFGWPLSSLEYTLHQSFLSSKPLSLNLHSNLIFLREIWVILLSDPPNLRATISSTISICSFLLGTCPLEGLGVVQESPRLQWTPKSLYCPLLHGDLIVENQTRSF
jgi:hypothetical protein